MMTLELARARVEVVAKEGGVAKFLSELIGIQGKDGRYSPEEQRIRSALKIFFDEQKNHIQAVEQAIETYRRSPSNGQIAKVVEQRFTRGLEKTKEAKVVFLQQHASDLAIFDKTDIFQLNELFSELLSAWKGDKDQLFAKHQAEKSFFKELLRKFSENRPKLPSLFISYSWGIAANVNRIHQIARHLKLAGFKVILDIWHNQTGNVPSFIERIDGDAVVNDHPFRADYVLLFCASDLKEKWHNRATGGASRGCEQEQHYRGHVLGVELTTIFNRYKNEPNQKKTVFPIIIRGMHDDVVPTFLKTEATTLLDFSNREEYFGKILALLGCLLPSESLSIKALSRVFKAKLNGDDELVAKLMPDITGTQADSPKLLMPSSHSIINKNKILHKKSESEAYYFVKEKFNRMSDSKVQQFCGYFDDDVIYVERAISTQIHLITQLMDHNFPIENRYAIYSGLIEGVNPVGLHHNEILRSLKKSKDISFLMKLALWELFSNVSTDWIPRELLNNFATRLNHDLKRKSCKPLKFNELK